MVLAPDVSLLPGTLRVAVPALPSVALPSALVPSEKATVPVTG